ncbi:MAG TPA: acetate/propionate family kinase [Terracidiphilus sp.]|nr:acetate/propionate family kinase [Terracidiphilus sp.]
MSLPVLVLNSGSSSIKFSVYEAAGGRCNKLMEGAVDGIGTDLGSFQIKDDAGNTLVEQSPALPNRSAAFGLVAEALNSGKFPKPLAIGHRMVSGGPTVKENQRITPGLIDEMERYTAFAPLHTPIAVHMMREALRLFPGVPNFVCLDTYFHRTMPEEAWHLPIPGEYTQLGVRRYGYHGISCESIVYQLGAEVPPRLIVAHLGNGASLTAIRDGKCVDTSMGLTPTGGIISGTRTGDIDPGVLLFALRRIAQETPGTADAADKLEAFAAEQAGLLGASRLTNDMRGLREAIAAGNENARLAVTLFTRTIAKWVGSLVVSLGGLDMLVFTGGIGVNDIDCRTEICARLAPLGIALDPERNHVRGQAAVSSPASRVAVRVIPPAEDLMIVLHVLRLLNSERDS